MSPLAFLGEGERAEIISLREQMVGGAKCPDRMNT